MNWPLLVVKTRRPNGSMCGVGVGTWVQLDEQQNTQPSTWVTTTKETISGPNPVGVGVPVDVAVKVGVGVRVGVREGVALRVGVPVNVGVNVRVTVGVCVGV